MRSPFSCFGLNGINDGQMTTNAFALGSRRYIGSKSKLTSWIMDEIDNEAPEAQSFCDIFAGTAIVSGHAMRRYEKVFVNDFLYSNNVIYRGFFSLGDWSKEKLQEMVDAYNRLSPDDLEDNYFSQYFGGKYYEDRVAKIIGYVRQDIEDKKGRLTEKEYFVLLASLIYSIDKLANTLGHFEAYIKKPIPSKPFRMRLINAQVCPNVEIFREDANHLVRRIQADVFYVDPPYNSRQYSRFYHVYETLVHWDKRKLFGAALKPKAENMSEYCSCRAGAAFADLIDNINARYIFVSYNNTYHSKSKSSRNKISLEEIFETLNRRGETKVLEHAHHFFNAGKTDFKDHKELLFVTKVR